MGNNKNRNTDYRMVVGVLASLIGIVSILAGIVKFGVPVGIPMLLVGILLITYVLVDKSGPRR
jgi:hypothetical protein